MTTDPTDVLILVDTSESVTENDLDDIKSWVTQVSTRLLDNNPDAAVAIAEYSTSYTQTTNFLSDAFAIDSQVNANLEASSGITNTGSAIMSALRFLDNSGRFGSNKVLILLTDGTTSSGNRVVLDTAIRQLDSRRLTGNFAAQTVGVGTMVSLTELQAISGNEDNEFEITSFGALRTVVNSVADTALITCAYGKSATFSKNVKP